MDPLYFRHYEGNFPPEFPAISPMRESLWQALAGLTTGLGLWYLAWRWTEALNPDALVFSVIVALAETLCFGCTLLFFYDIWAEGDTPCAPAPRRRGEVGLAGEGPIRIDVFITTYDEAVDLVRATVEAALRLEIPPGVLVRTWLCDDGRRPEMADLARELGVTVLTRPDNRGFKAGNLRNALAASHGDFFVICDADTRLLPRFLIETLGYFRDPKVAWVQTPQWFYDIPGPPSMPVGGWGPDALLRRLKRAVQGAGDPLLADPVFFYDVIQRRRNRHGASFCCGAGSIHRREAVFNGALAQLGREVTLGERRWLSWIARAQRLECFRAFRSRILRGRTAGLREDSHATAADPAAILRLSLSATEQQPFRFHVSEDLLTSIYIHSEDAGWRSVFHPQPLSRMLAPCSLAAWSVQSLKYAGGTFDIAINERAIFRRGMPTLIRLHYAATVASYLTVLWMPVLLLAPVAALGFGISPVVAYGPDFFMHLLPLIVANEAALLAASKGHAVHKGRLFAHAALPIQLRALIAVLRGRRPRFPVTPKTPAGDEGLQRLWPNLALLALFAAGAVTGLVRYLDGDPAVPVSMLVVNLFWIAINAASVGWIILAARWSVAPAETAHTTAATEVPA